MLGNRGVSRWLRAVRLCDRGLVRGGLGGLLGHWRIRWRLCVLGLGNGWLICRRLHRLLGHRRLFGRLLGRIRRRRACFCRSSLGTVSAGNRCGGLGRLLRLLSLLFSLTFRLGFCLCRLTLSLGFLGLPLCFGFSLALSLGLLRLPLSFSFLSLALGFRFLGLTLSFCFLGLALRLSLTPKFLFLRLALRFHFLRLTLSLGLLRLPL